MDKNNVSLLDYLNIWISCTKPDKNFQGCLTGNLKKKIPWQKKKNPAKNKGQWGMTKNREGWYGSRRRKRKSTLQTTGTRVSASVLVSASYFYNIARIKFPRKHTAMIVLPTPSRNFTITKLMDSDFTIWNAASYLSSSMD